MDRPVITLLLSRRCTIIIMGTKELSTFLEKQFRRTLAYDQVCEILDNFSVASVVCLITPTLDPSVLNQITLTETKKCAGP